MPQGRTLPIGSQLESRLEVSAKSCGSRSEGGSREVPPRGSPRRAMFESIGHFALSSPVVIRPEGDAPLPVSVPVVFR